MPGAIAGAVQGFEAGDAAHARAAMLGIEQQRVALEQQRQQTEIDRQKNFDTLSVTQQQIGNLANAVHQHLAFLSAAPKPPDMESDPDAYKKWDASNDGQLYHQHAKAVDGVADQLQDLTAQADKARSAITGTVFNQAKSRAAQNTAGLLSGATHPNDMSPGDMADLLSLKSHLAPHMFVPDSETHIMPAQQIENQLQSGIATGDWRDKGNAVAALVQDHQPKLGSALSGGTVSGSTIGDVTPDGKGNLQIQWNMQVHMPDGSTKTVSTPKDALVMPMSDMGRRATKFQKIVDFAAHPDVQAKTVAAFKNGDTSWHKVNDMFLAAGVPQSELLGTPYTSIEKLGPYDSLVGIGPGGKTTTISQPNQEKMPSGVTGEALRIQSEAKAKGIDLPFADALDQANSSFQNRKAPPDPMVDELRQQRLDDAKQKRLDQMQKNADLQHTGAVRQLAHKLGYKVDSQNNVTYGDDSPDHKKGEPVKDPDFEDQVADMKHTSDEAAQSGKPLSATKLLSGAKDALDKAKLTPKPLPQSKDPKDFSKGQSYNVPGKPGNWIWDGTQLVKAK